MQTHKKPNRSGLTAGQLAFMRECTIRGLPEPVPEVKFHPTRRWRIDWVFNGWLGLEIQGGIWIAGRHSRGRGMEKDYEKFNRATIMGYSILFCTPRDVKSGAIFQTLGEAICRPNYPPARVVN